MKADQQIWQAWADKLHRWGLGDWVAFVLEAAGPLTLLGAQMIYLSQPFLSSVWVNGQMEALAGMLEEPDRTKMFVTFLREEHS